MTLEKDFERAVKTALQFSKRPGNDDLLALYSLYKQATEGDARGGRPGLLDLKGRKKFDAWALRKGMSREAAMSAYNALVAELGKTHRE